MVKYLPVAIIYLFFFQTSSGQGLRKLTEYEQSPPISTLFYKSDSVFYGHSSGLKTNCVFKNNKWNPLLSLNNGRIFTSPKSKIYFIDKTSFSIINPVTHQKEKTYPVSLNSIPGYFEVFNDSFFIVFNYNYTFSDTIYKYSFNEQKVTKNSLGRIGEFYPYFKMADDTLFYYYIGGYLYKKNLKTGTTKLVYHTYQLKALDCYKNYVAILNSNSITFSDNYGQSFRIIDLYKYGLISMPTVVLGDKQIVFYAYPNRLVSIDFFGNEKKSVPLQSITHKLTTYYSYPTCEHLEGFSPIVWLNDTTWVVPSYDADVYKVYPFKGKVKYLGGSFNLGVESMHFSPKGNLVFWESGNGLWAVSSDTGKKWHVAETSVFTKVKRFEFKDSSIFILNDNKLNIYHYGTDKIDTSLYSLGLKIIDFVLTDNKSLTIFTVSATYNLNLNTHELSVLGPRSPFENFVYLKKSKRILAVTYVDIFYSDNYGKNWQKSNLSGYEFFTSLAFDNILQVEEITQNQISLKAIFNDTAVILQSNDGGKSFVIKRDPIILGSIPKIKLYDDIYFLNENNEILKSDINGKVSVEDHYTDDCPAVGMQAFDSGFFMWNSRAEIFYKKVPYKKVYAYSEKISIYPNPVNSDLNLNILLPKDLVGKIESLELFDMIGRKHENLSFEYLENENIYIVKNLPPKATQFYMLVVKMEGKVALRERILIY